VSRASSIVPALLFVAGCSGPSGLRIDIDLGQFASRLATLSVTVSAMPGGFTPLTSASNGGVTLSTDDAMNLVVRFDQAAGYHFASPLSFRVETGNREALTMHAEALGADDTSTTIAAGDGMAPLSGGGHATIAIKLIPYTGPITPQTLTTDLATAGSATSVTTGPRKDAMLGAVAVCNVDADMYPDLVFGVPGAAPNDAIGATGAVYVIFGGASGFPATIDLSNVPAGTREFHVYGAVAGDRLGTAVACADVDGDSAADLIMGAPRAEGGAGAVYVLQGAAALPNTVYDLSHVPPAKDAPGATLVGADAQALLGSALYAANLDGDSKPPAEVLISAPGEGGVGRVHLLTGILIEGGAWHGRQVLDTTAPAHVMFAGIPAAALGAGDLDNSGVPLDIILGDPAFQSSAGAAYVFSQVDPTKPQTFDAGGAQIALVGAARSGLGAAVLALDTQATGLGWQDLVVGVPGDTEGMGAVNIYTADNMIFQGTPMRTASRTLHGFAAGDRFGSALAGVTTSNGNTRLFVGAPIAAPSTRDRAGAAYVYQGSAVGPQLVEQIFGAAPGDGLGTALTGGELGGNLVPDVVVVAPNATAVTGTNAGAAYVRIGSAASP